MPHIRVDNLTLRYGGREALRRVSLDIPDGRITAIIGPSGCGKTTLLKSLNRLTDLNEEVTAEGAVLIDGENIFDPAADVLALRKKLGYMSQRPFPLPMSIYDNITFGPRIHRMKRLTSLSRLGEFIKQHDVPGFDVDAALRAAEGRPHGARDLLVEFYLRLASLWDEVRDRLHAPASRLSIGQQQRLALARTLAVEPEAILADEPTSALDPISAQLIERQFRALKKNYSIIVVTHILRQARRIADYVVFLYLGELIEHGPAEEFFANPKDPRTRAYISGEIS